MEAKRKRFGSRAGSVLRDFPSWLYVLTVVVVAAALIAAVDLLHDAVVEPTDVQVLLGDLAGDAAELHAVQLQAVAAGEVREETRRAILREREELEAEMAELFWMDLRPGDYATITELYGRSQSAELAVVESLERGRVEEARTLSTERAEPAFREFGDYMDRARGDYRAMAERAELANTVGIIAAGILGASALLVTFLRYESSRRRDRAVLAESEQRHRSLFEQNPDGVYSLYPSGRIATANPGLHEILGYSEEELAGRNAARFVVPEHRRHAAERFSMALAGVSQNYETALVRRDGRRVEIAMTQVPIVVDGELTGVYGIAKDITQRRAEREELGRTEARYRTLVERVPAVTYGQDLEGTHTVDYVSPQIERITGYTSEEFLADPELWYAVIHPDDVEWIRAEDERTNRTHEPFRAEYRLVHRDGRVVWVHDEAVLVPNASGTPNLWQGIMTDITERKSLEHRLRHQALHDPLTGLPNRNLFEDRLTHALERARRRSERVAVLFVDLDNFKYVNDSLGHEVGDGLLVAVAGRIGACLRPEDTLARLGGDEFTILIEDVADEGAAIAIVDRVERGLKEPFRVGRREVYMTASIGIAFSNPASRVRPQDLLRHADLAMYGAKGDGKMGHRVFEESMTTSVTRRLDMESDLRRAVERAEFRVYYQPRVSLKTGEILGFEALVRWRHPERGLVLPSEFILLAEEMGLVGTIGMRVMEEACGRVREWRAMRPRALPAPSVSVNVSPRQFLQPDLGAEVTRVLDRCGIEPEALELEITETVLAEDAVQAQKVLCDLRDLGVRVSIDDFGTGYSSLARLRDLPVDALKIDRSFVAGLGENPSNGVLVSGMIELAAGLGLEVSAEGVENARQAAALRALGCESAQGFYFSIPVEGDAALKLLLRSPGGRDRVLPR